MKKNILFVILLAMLSAISGLLMSKMSFIGRVGINLMHKEYKFLKIWWHGGLAVFMVLLVLFLVHAAIQRAMPNAVAKVIHLLLFAAAAGGLYLTYNDFQDDFTHSLLKSNFHMGVYVFWASWMLEGLFFLSKKKAPKPMLPGADAPAQLMQ